VRFAVKEYDLAATLASGQVFRWRRVEGDAWEGVLGNQWFRLRQSAGGVEAETLATHPRWDCVRHFLGLGDDLAAIRETFPVDEPMRAAVQACPGLRLLRQDPWECTASFILSSTKQIVQIQQCAELLAERFGEPVEVPAGHAPAFSFPSMNRLAGVTEAELRSCKLGFRARYLGETARLLSRDGSCLETLARLPTVQAREILMNLPGIGRKIADCVLLFAYGRQDAFPVDVWVLRALRTLYFPEKNPSPRTLEHFTANHFGPYAGYAQQYLFHYFRTCIGRTESSPPSLPRAGRTAGKQVS
jgi:N-glycosylase/DNA lyase